MEYTVKTLAQLAGAHLEDDWARGLGEVDPYYHPALSARKGKWRLK